MNIPCHLNIVDAMDYLYFILVRSSAKLLSSHKQEFSRGIQRILAHAVDQLEPIVTV